jgi:hypothetical protein
MASAEEQSSLPPKTCEIVGVEGVSTPGALARPAVNWAFAVAALVKKRLKRRACRMLPFCFLGGIFEGCSVRSDVSPIPLKPRITRTPNSCRVCGGS